MGVEGRGKREEGRGNGEDRGSRSEERGSGSSPQTAIRNPQSGVPLAAGAEFDLIRGFFAGGVPASRPDVRVGVGDDCAVVVGNGIALSCDMSVEGVHFRRDWLDDREVGYRAAAAALSDLAAVAARPIGVLVALALPDGYGRTIAQAVMEGVASAAARVGAAILGGDVSRTAGPLVVDVTAVGEAAEPVLRGGARPGDEVWVTGELGGAAAAVTALARGDAPEPALRERFAAPSARTREALWLRERGVLRAAIDLSDGLAGDAAHIAAASGVAIVLDREAIPVHPAVRRVAASPDEAFRLALGGGEDYELCFAAARGTVEPLAPEFEREFDLRLVRVGWVEAGEGIFVRSAVGRESIGFGGYQHFEGEV
jgi:thiamine-monophosphate kinase